MIIFSWINAQHIFFSCLAKTLYCLGIEVVPAYQVIKKLKMNHLLGSTRYIATESD